MKTNHICNAGKLAIVTLLFLTLFSCSNSGIPGARHIHQTATYESFTIVVKDTIDFLLSEHMYNNIVSSNFFYSKGISYVSFYEKGSKSLIIYDYNRKEIIKHVRLVAWVHKNKLDKASVFVKNFDSIFVTTQESLYHLDSSGFIKSKVDFFPEKEKTGTVNNTEPAVVKGNHLYIGVKPNVNEKSLGAHRAWRALYKIDLQTGKKELSYRMPVIYHKNLYGYPYMDYGYCVNEKGNFVFSFAADTSIYESDLNSFHTSYNAQSRFHKGPIPTLTREQIEGPGTYKIYSMQDSYGPVIYYPYKKIYLRQAKQGISAGKLAEKDFSKKRSIIILDSNFKIIGEPECNIDFSFTSVFFADNGKIYARVNARDESALHYAEIIFEKDTPQLTSVFSKQR